MDLRYQASRILHDDHMASLGLLADVERLVLAGKTPPAQDDPDMARFLARLRGALAGEISAHFDFEEETLFPILTQNGDGDLCGLLVEEHHVLREVMAEIVGRAPNATTTAGEWSTFRRICGELVERLQSHVEKEERALVPTIEGAFSPEIDAEACARHDP